MKKTFKDKMNNHKMLILPGVYDALSALLAQQTGFEAVYLSGASISYTRLGRSDVGLVSVSEVANTLEMICDRVDIPVMVDADNGYGNALNVQRTVRQFERAGASAIQLEDQSYPKRCGHLNGKILIKTSEMVGKINAALDARKSEETLIVARTDAISVEGLSEAIERAQRYCDAGADIIFVEAPSSIDDMSLIVESLAPRVPLLANMVEGGQTPLLTADKLKKIGYKLVIFPGGLVRAQTYLTQRYLAQLLRDGSTINMLDKMVDFQKLNEIIGTEELLILGARYDTLKGDE
jgi:carboxyvinyl-carboxyphosphonate phosphorylmutase